MSQDKISAFLDKGNVFAVVGVSRDPAKYGHKVFFDLVDGGYEAYAVHPEGGEVKGRKRYPRLSDLPAKPDVVDVVVPPAATEQVVRECAELGIRKVWMQPGSESQEAVEYCESQGIETLHGVCVMAHRRAR